MVKDAYLAMKNACASLNRELPVNRPEKFRHPLDCAAINYLHKIHGGNQQTPIDSIKAIFQEPPKLYPGSVFMEKNHIQIAIRNLDCMKGVFRVPKKHLDPNV